MGRGSKPRITNRTVGDRNPSEASSIEAIAAEIAKLRTMTCSELAELYEQRFGVKTTTHNAKHLRRKLAAKIQLDAIPPKERERLEMLEPKALEMLQRRVERRRNAVPKVKVTTTNEASSNLKPTAPTILRDPRLPPVGTVITKKHKADTHQITVLADSFEWNGKSYPSLSRIAFLMTGTRWNGFLFFDLIERKPNPRKETTNA